MPKAMISIPPAAGPTIRLALPPTAFKAMALPSSARGIVFAISACRTGMLMASPVPMTKLKTMACQTRTRSRATSRANTTAAAAKINCSTMSMRRRSRRSAATPPKGPRKRKGRERRADVIPTIVAEPDNFQTSQLTVTCWFQKPAMFSRLPAHR